MARIAASITILATPNQRLITIQHSGHIVRDYWSKGGQSPTGTPNKSSPVTRPKKWLAKDLTVAWTPAPKPMVFSVAPMACVCLRTPVEKHFPIHTLNHSALAVAGRPFLRSDGFGYDGPRELSHANHGYHFWFIVCGQDCHLPVL